MIDRFSVVKKVENFNFKHCRLSHVIMLVPNIHWIIIEDAVETSKLVKSLLDRAGLKSRSTLLNSKTPDDFKLKAKVIKPRPCTMVQPLLYSK